MKLPLKAQISFDPKEVARDLIEAYVLETAMADPELAARHVLENLGRDEIAAFAQGFFTTMQFQFDYAETRDVIPVDRRLAIAVIGRLIRNRFKPLVDEGVDKAAVTEITTRNFEGSEDRKIKAAIALLTSYGYSVT